MTNASGTNSHRRTAASPEGEGTDSPSRFPRYPEYKDSGVEWLGEVPAHWPVSPLKRVARLITGITPSTTEIENYAEVGFPWIRPEDLDESGAPTMASKFLSPLGEEEIRTVGSGSTLICCIGTIGKVGYITARASTNQQITVAVPMEVPRYLYYAVIAARSQLELLATGNVLRILNSERLGGVRITVPPLPEQTAIAAFLDRETAKIDALVAEQETLIALLKEKRQAVISHAVTKGLNPDAPMKPSGIEWLGEVPAHWVVTSPTKAFEVLNGYAFPAESFSDAGVPIVRMSDIGKGILVLDNAKLVNSDLVPERFFLRDGDVVLGLSGSIESVAMVSKRNLPCALNQRVAAFRGRASISVVRWAYWFHQTASYQEQIFSLLPQTTIVNVGAEELRAVRMVLPPVSEQTAIASFLDRETAKVDEMMAHVGCAITLFKERRSALISAAVTGQIDVRGENES